MLLFIFMVKRNNYLLCMCIIIRFSQMVTKGWKRWKHCSRIWIEKKKELRVAYRAYEEYAIRQNREAVCLHSFSLNACRIHSHVEKAGDTSLLSFDRYAFKVLVLNVQMRIVCFDPFSAYNEHASRRMSNCKTNQQLREITTTKKPKCSSSGGDRNSSTNFQMKWVPY